MVLQDLDKNRKVIIQIVWGERDIEFPSHVVDSDVEGIYIEPYLHNGNPLKLSIDPSGGIPCHLFGDDTENGTRVSWRNIRLETVERGGQTLYHLSTMAFNRQAKTAERRAHERNVVRKMGNGSDTAGNVIQVMVHDMSDNGISFFAPASFTPNSKNMTVGFADSLGGELFRVQAECRIVYRTAKSGTIFYGCEVLNGNSDYFLYGCMQRMQKNKKPDLIISGDDEDASGQPGGDGFSFPEGE